MPNIARKKWSIDKILGLIAVLVVGLALGSYIWRGEKSSPPPSGNTSFFTGDTGDIRGEESPAAQADEPDVEVPLSVSWPVAFTPQAPTANWDELHNEACEEASVIMAHYYFDKIPANEAKINSVEVEREITKLTNWQDDNYGYHLSIDTEETKRMAEEVYGLKTKILTGFSEEQIKQELAANRLIILPADGQLLGNPNFRPPGPPYHMLVIKGYDSNGFITNDPGTRLGYNYRYSFDVLHQSAGDYNHSTKLVDTRTKMALVVWK